MDEREVAVKPAHFNAKVFAVLIGVVAVLALLLRVLDLPSGTNNSDGGQTSISMADMNSIREAVCTQTNSVYTNVLDVQVVNARKVRVRSGTTVPGKFGGDILTFEKQRGSWQIVSHGAWVAD